MPDQPDINSIVNTEVNNTINGENTTVDKLNLLLNLTPQELTDTLMSTYPVKQIIPPSPEEIEASEMKIPTPEYLDTDMDKKDFRESVEAFQTILKRNRVVDVFPNHEERIAYEDALKKVLQTVDILNNRKEGEVGYTSTWAVAWDNNKYTRNSLTGIYAGLIRLTMIPIPEEMLNQVQENIRIVQQIANPENQETDESKTDEDIQPAIDIAINTLKMFAE